MIYQLFLLTFVALAVFSSALIEADKKVAESVSETIVDVITYTKSKSWTSVDCSADGQFAYALGASTYIYSTADFGSTWTESFLTLATWNAIAASSSGAIVYAGESYGSIYKTDNYGASWNKAYTSSSSYPVNSLAVSSAGDRVFAASSYNVIRVSSDSGATFIAATLPSTLASSTFTSIAANGDGQHVAAATSAGAIILSSDFGKTFSQVYTSSLYFSGIAISNAGDILRSISKVYSYNEGFLLESYDYGNTSTWRIANDQNLDFRALATASSTGSTYTAVYNGKISQLKGSGLVSLIDTVAYWSSLAASSTGKYIYATASSGYVYRLKVSE